jgi:DamX protein
MGQLDAPGAENCFESLGLTFDPFADGAMPAFFFVGGQRRYLAQRVVQRLYFSGGVVLLLGASGAGKTRLIDEISAELRDIADICRIDATVLMDAVQIRALLAESIGLPFTPGLSAPDLVVALGRNRPGEEEPLPVALLIDSAHLLSIDALIETVSLVQSSGGRLRLLLAGEGELATSWQQTNIGGAELLELPALDRQETADYLHTRLQAAGCKLPMPFDGAVLDALFAQTGGNIGQVHAQVARLLAPAAEKVSLPQRVKALPVLHIGIISALLAAVILLALYRGGGSTPAGDTAPALSPTANPDKYSIPLALPDRAPIAEAPVATAEVPVPQPETTTKPAPLATPAPVAQSHPVRNAPDIAVKLAATKSAPATTPKPAVAKAAPPPAVRKPAPPPEDAGSAPTFSADERELLALPSQQFMLQLLGAESRATVDKFAAGAGRGQRLLTYRTQLRGKPWFIVLTGPFPSRAAAQAAVEKMPETLRKQQPWPRSVANVQADIRAHAKR